MKPQRFVTALMTRPNVADWTVQDVIDFFASIGMQDMEDQLRSHRVDGLLLTHLDEDDWSGELNVTSSLRLKRIMVEMERLVRTFPSDARIGNTREKRDSTSGANVTNAEYGGSESQDDAVGDDSIDQSVSIEVSYPGEDSERPKDGDVVRIHYSLSIAGAPSSTSTEGDGSATSCVERTRERTGRPCEFVLGAAQLIRGLEVALKRFGRGERSVVTVAPHYAYGTKGLLPAIPPDATIVIDVELIDFWPRPIWRKPWVQRPGLCQRPYARTDIDEGEHVGPNDDEAVNGEEGPEREC